VDLIMLRILWRLTAGYHLRPWRSPYLQWRMETYSGIHAADVTFSRFWSFAWAERRELWRYLRWAEAMQKRATGQGKRDVTVAAPGPTEVGTEPRA
jgi:hypothetical protein